MATQCEYDVIVYGGTASGAIAAIAAAQAGSRTALLEPRQHIGGMVSGGLGYTDFGDRTVIGGLALEFYSRVAAHYGVETWGYVGPEPHVAEQILRDWLRVAGVEVFFYTRLASVVVAALHPPPSAGPGRGGRWGRAGVWLPHVLDPAAGEPASLPQTRRVRPGPV